MNIIRNISRLLSPSFPIMLVALKNLGVVQV
jgi:hypothetical protein